MDAGKLYIPDAKKWINFYQDQVKDYYDATKQKPKRNRKKGSGAFAIVNRKVCQVGGGRIGTQYRSAGTYILPINGKTDASKATKDTAQYTLITPAAAAVEQAKSELASGQQSALSSNQIASPKGIRKTADGNNQRVNNKRKQNKSGGEIKEQQRRKADKRKLEGKGSNKNRKVRRYDDIFSR